MSAVFLLWAPAAPALLALNPGNMEMARNAHPTHQSRSPCVEEHHAHSTPRNIHIGAGGVFWLILVSMSWLRSCIFAFDSMTHCSMHTCWFAPVCITTLIVYMLPCQTPAQLIGFTHILKRPKVGYIYFLFTWRSLPNTVHAHFFPEAILLWNMFGGKTHTMVETSHTHQTNNNFASAWAYTVGATLFICVSFFFSCEKTVENAPYKHTHATCAP